MLWIGTWNLIAATTLNTQPQIQHRTRLRRGKEKGRKQGPTDPLPAHEYFSTPLGAEGRDHQARVPTT
eukprot:scaffold1807_cov127-Skeletonema_marinoi.AAC.3